jgi:hypothetical protein
MEHWQNIINIVGGAILAGMGWFCREIWDSVKALREDVHRIEINLPESYIKRSEIETRLDKIDMRFEKLDQHITKLFERIELSNHK